MVEEHSSFTLIGNMQHYGGAILRPFKGARPDDGRLNVCCFKGTKGMDLLRYLLAACVHRLWALRDVTHYTGKEIRIDSQDRIQVQVDGDPGGELPMTVKVLPNAVAFCVPLIS